MRIVENVALAGYTTLGVGGPARFFCEAFTELDVEEGVARAASLAVPILVMGGGSNLLIADRGFEGLAIRMRPAGFDAVEDGGAVIVTVGAGEAWDTVVERCVDLGLAGIECLSGIPGSAGGTPVQNVGAYGQEVAETIVSVRCFDRETGAVVELANAECGFSYRKSIFNSVMPGRYIVLSIRFRLVRDGRPRVSYRDLLNLLDPENASLADVRRCVIEIRRQKSMVIDPTDPNSKSAGSFFKNPVIAAADAEGLAEKLGTDRAVTFPTEDGDVKVSAAWLIEQCGFHKGLVFGNVGISAKHSLALINRGGASAAEVVALKERIRGTVLEKTGIELVPEPVFVGF